MERFAGIALALFGMFCLLLPTTRRDRWLSALPRSSRGEFCTGSPNAIAKNKRSDRLISPSISKQETS
nr:hypothetical protein [Synechococcus elongatus]AZB72693.1 hypothetical protein DOP62_08215 [Synechococcus elongatus PCC 11801]